MSDLLESLREHQRVIAALEPRLPEIERAARRMIDALSAGGKIVWMGNGGSAADAQHLAAELVGRFERDRPALASLAVTTDTSILTAVGNDMGLTTSSRAKCAACASRVTSSSASPLRATVRTSCARSKPPRPSVRRPWRSLDATAENSRSLQTRA